MSVSMTFVKKVAASDIELAATCLKTMIKIFFDFGCWS